MGTSSPDEEVSPHNPAARRVPGGIWNEDSLPVLDWEAPEHRVVLPRDLQQALGIDVPVLRWDRTKRERGLHKHRRDLPVILALHNHISDWRFAGRESKNPANRRVLFERDGRWYALSTGVDENGSHNVITVFGSRSKSFLTNRLRGIAIVMERGKRTSARAAGLASPEKAWKPHLPKQVVPPQRSLSCFNSTASVN